MPMTRFYPRPNEVTIPLTIRSANMESPLTIPIRIEATPPTIPIRIEQPQIPFPQPMFPGGQITTRQEGPMEVKGKLEMVPAKKEYNIQGFDIPEFASKAVRIGRLRQPGEEKEIVNLTYPLIPQKPEKGEPVFAYAKIYWNAEHNKYIYEVVEPELTDNVLAAMIKVKDLLEQKLDIDFSKLKKFEAVEYLHKNVEDLINYFGIRLSKPEKDILHYHIQRDFIGLGKIEALMNDKDIEDISCDGIGIPIYIFHRDPSVGSIETNVAFDDASELDSFIIKLSQLAGKSISVASPLVGGSLPDGSRVQATLATDIARRGSNFTIRRFTEEPLTPTHLLLYNTLDVPIMAYLWLAVDFGRNVIVSGGTASGKTTILNVLSLFIRPEKKIVSIEDTPELKLPHPHWVPTVARTAMSVEGSKRIGEVDMFDLLRESFRQRPDYIVVGEVRGKEAFVLFQEMATGHPSLATIHAEDEAKLIDRLTTPPIDLPANLLGSLDIMVFLLRVRYKEKHVRRVNEVLEVVSVDPDTKTPITNKLFRWNPINDTFEVQGKSAILKKISDAIGLSPQQIKDELERRMFVLNWMQENRILSYKDVYNVLQMYYAYPERVLATIMGEA